PGRGPRLARAAARRAGPRCRRRAGAPRGRPGRHRVLAAHRRPRRPLPLSRRRRRGPCRAPAGRGPPDVLLAARAGLRRGDRARPSAPRQRRCGADLRAARLHRGRGPRDLRRSLASSPVLVEPWLERARPDVLAVETADGALTYAELIARARTGAAHLR